MSSSSLPAAAPASVPVSCSAAAFMKVMCPSLSVVMIASARSLQRQQLRLQARAVAGQAQRLQRSGWG